MYTHVISVTKIKMVLGFRAHTGNACRVEGVQEEVLEAQHPADSEMHEAQ